MCRQFILILFPLLLMGCNNTSHYEYWDISKFHLKADALADKEEIKLIYASRGPDYNQDSKYYFHLIVVSQKTGDTVNILTEALNDLNQESGQKIFNYLSPENPVSRDFHVNTKITKVARDPDFDDIADNDYPTVFGFIGTITITPKQ